MSNMPEKTRSIELEQLINRFFQHTLGYTDINLRNGYLYDDVYSKFKDQIADFSESEALEFRDLFSIEEIEVLNTVEVELVYIEGGEGQGEYYESVYMFTSPKYENQATWTKFIANYYSYDGAEFQDYTMTFPSKVEVIRY